MAVIQPEYFCDLPRYRTLQQLRQYYKSEQYEGRADFFTGLKGNAGGAPVPLRERKPCIIYPLPRNAVQQVVRFTFGESRFPVIGVEEIDADNSVDGERLSKDDAETLEKFIATLIDTCELKPAMRRVMRPGLAVGTSVAMLSVEDGMIRLSTAQAEDVLCQFKNGKPGSEVLRATWSYQFEDSVPGKDGKPEQKRFWFRQDYTEQEFIEYARVEATPGKPPEWKVSTTTVHGFGFCPVFWIRNIGEEDSGQLDGASIYHGLLPDFDALNFAISQRHRGINFFGVPQAWETGVEEDDGPRATGRQARITDSGYVAPSGTSPHGAVAGGGGGAPTVKIGPDQKWTYRNDKAAVGLLETTGKAFEAGTLHVNDIRARALESMSVVIVNISEVMGRTQQGQMSAKFLELAYEPLLALVDEMRHCWWPSALRPILSGALRIVAALEGKGLYLPGAVKAAQLLKAFLRPGADGKTRWQPPKMVPTWGDYFSAGAEEITAAVGAAQAAKDARLIPEADAIKYVLPYFGREDPTEAIAEIEADKLKASEAEAEASANELTKLHAIASAGGGNADPGGTRAAGGGKPKQTASGGSGGASASDTS